MEVSERDWKLFRKKLPAWQEAYMDRLNKTYMEILIGEGPASEKFWKLHDSIRQDRKSPGVMIERLSRSNMIPDIRRLLVQGVIQSDDLEDFSDELKAVFCFQ